MLVYQKEFWRDKSYLIKTYTKYYYVTKIKKIYFLTSLMHKKKKVTFRPMIVVIRVI